MAGMTNSEMAAATWANDYPRDAEEAARGDAQEAAGKRVDSSALTSRLIRSAYVAGYLACLRERS